MIDNKLIEKIKKAWDRYSQVKQDTPHYTATKEERQSSTMRFKTVVKRIVEAGLDVHITLFRLTNDIDIIQDHER